MIKLFFPFNLLLILKIFNITFLWWYYTTYILLPTVWNSEQNNGVLIWYVVCGFLDMDSNEQPVPISAAIRFPPSQQKATINLMLDQTLLDMSNSWGRCMMNWQWDKSIILQILSKSLFDLSVFLVKWLADPFGWKNPMVNPIFFIFITNLVLQTSGFSWKNNFVFSKISFILVFKFEKLKLHF
jgi:hypothetical protein